jgi:CBS domain-containing protein
MHVTTILAAKGHEVFSIGPDVSVADLIRSLCEHNVGAVLVVDDSDEIVGIVSERDVVRALGANAQALSESVSSIMTREVVTAPDTAEVADLMQLMTKRRIRHVPILNEANDLVGMVSIGDVVKNRMDELEADRSALMDYITHGG